MPRPSLSADTKLTTLLNASGFAFQLAIEAAIAGISNQTEWRVTGREHPWKTSTGTGYIDLVVSRGHTHLLVECKRPRDATWLFLMPDPEQLCRSHATVCWTDTAPHRPDLTGWGDVQIYPSSPEADFCAIRGQGETDSPMLERVCAQVCNATDGLAADFLTLGHQSRSTHVIIPVIVTTADLQISEFDPADVDLGSGQLAKASFAPAGHVRFRKSLAGTSVPDDYEPDELEHLSVASVRTVFVVGAPHLTTWLKEYQMSAPDSSSPWVQARNRADAMS